MSRSLVSGAKAGSPEGVLVNYPILQKVFFEPEPERWGGAFVDGDVLVVLAHSQSVDEAARKLNMAGVRGAVEVRPAVRSISELELLAERALAFGSAALVSVGPMYSRGVIVVGMSRDDLAFRSYLAGLAPGAFEAYLTAPAHRTSRFFDTSPFSGGGQILLKTAGASGGAPCSSGFAWNDPSGDDEFIVTASHCYASGGLWRGQVHRVTSTNTWLQIGTVTWSSGNSSGTVTGKRGDVAAFRLLPGLRGSNRVFVGACNTLTRRDVVGWTSLPEGWKGSNLWSSGSGCAQTTNGQPNGTGEVMLDWVSLVNQTVVYTDVVPSQTFKNLSVGENESVCFRDGDSGGSVYLRLLGGTAAAVGIVSGTNNSGGLFTNCRNYFTPVGVVVADFGGTPRTS